MATFPAVYFLFAAFSLLFFIQYPLAGSLAGDLDTIANLAMFKHLKMYLDYHLFSCAVSPDFCYPAKNTWLLYGADFGSGIIHIFFNYIGFNDLWANYLYYSTIFSLNGFTLFLLIRKILNRGRIAPILASLVFTFSHFTLANIENPNTLIFFPSFISLLFLRNYFTKYNLSDLAKSIFWGCLTIYLSPVNFVTHILVWAFFVLFPGSTVPLTNKLKIIFLSSLVYLFFTSPFFYFFVFKIHQINFYNLVTEKGIVKHLSLSINDLFEVLKGHLYLPAREIPSQPWLTKIKSAYLGVIYYLTFAAGLFLIRKSRYLLILFLLALLISIGPYITYNFKVIMPSLMYPFYEILNFGNYIRIPIRFFLISVLAGTIVIAFLFDYLKAKGKFYFAVIIVILILLENIPFRMETYGNNQKKVLSPSKAAFEYLKSKSNLQILYFLPSDILSYQGDRNEYIYMFWQQFHYKTIVNGNVSFIPSERLYAKELTDDFNDKCIQEFFDFYNVDAFVFAKSLAGEESEAILTKLKKSENLLTLTFEDNDFIVFEKNI